MSKGKLLVRAVEVVLIGWILAEAAVRFSDTGDATAGLDSIIFSATLVAVIEAGIWLIPRVARWAKETWRISSDELLFRAIQIVIVVAMVADGTWWLFTGTGFGVNQAGCLLALVALEGIIRRFVRPDPRPAALKQALQQLQTQVRVFTQLPPEKVKESLGLVRGLSDIEASSRRDFALAEQEALYAMLREARMLGANAVVDARLTTGTYETDGSQWQVARPVYTGTAVRI